MPPMPPIPPMPPMAAAAAAAPLSFSGLSATRLSVVRTIEAMLEAFLAQVKAVDDVVKAMPVLDIK